MDRPLVTRVRGSIPRFSGPRVLKQDAEPQVDANGLASTLSCYI